MPAPTALVYPLTVHVYFPDGHQAAVDEARDELELAELLSSVDQHSVFFRPGAEFAFYEHLGAAIAAASPSAKASLRLAQEMDTDDTWSGLVFVDRDGAFVSDSWTPGQPLINAPCSPEKWNARFNAALLRGYGVDIEDVELAYDDLSSLASGRHARFPEQAAREYAEDHDLDAVPSPRRAPSP